MVTHAQTGTRHRGWDYAAAWRRAQARIAAASGLDVVAESAADVEPVQRARRAADIAAPANMRLILALTHGTSLADLAKERHGVRIMADLAFRQLAVVGLKSGESVEHDVSDRLKSALGLWFGSSGEGDEGHDDLARARRATEE